MGSGALSDTLNLLLQLRTLQLTSPVGALSRSQPGFSQHAEISLPEPPKGCSSLPTLRVGGGGILGARCSGPGRPGTLFHIPCLGALHFANLTAPLQKSWVLPALVPARQSGTPNPVPLGE